MELTILKEVELEGTKGPFKVSEQLGKKTSVLNYTNEGKGLTLNPSIQVHPKPIF